MDRPTALDLAFVDLETPQAPLHVGWTLRFAGPPPPLAAVRRHLDARLDAVPRFRRRLVGPGVGLGLGLGLGAPYWADDAGFDIAHHVFAVSLPAPGDNAQLRDAAGALLSDPLPADRPLWRVYLVDGLADGGFALVGQAHHLLVDGIAAVEVALLLFAPVPQRAGRPAWAPQPAPTARQAATATVAVRVRATGATVRGMAAALRPAHLADARHAIEQASRPVPTTVLDRSLTADRVLAWAQVPFEAVRAAGRRHQATVNDVLMAAAALALRRALRRHGECHDTLRALMPISVRHDQPANLGNRISFVPVDLPVGEPDPLRVLAMVRSRTREAKSGATSAALQALAVAGDALPDAGRRLVTRTAARIVGFNLVISNVPGPPTALTLLGRRLTAVFPMVPLLHGHALTIGALSYDGSLNLGLAADAAVLPDVALIGADLRTAFGTLLADARAGRFSTTRIPVPLG